MANQKLGPKGAREVAEALQMNSTVSTLKFVCECQILIINYKFFCIISLGLNDILVEGARHLVTVLLTNTRVSKLM